MTGVPRARVSEQRGVDVPAAGERVVVDHRVTGGADRIVAHRRAQMESGSGATRSLQVRIEESPVGRTFISAVVLVTMAAILVVCMPASTIRSTLATWAQPYLSAVGLGEDWGVFAPSPRTTVIYGTARIRYSDGSSSEWSFPARTGVMAYSDYRWQKFEEHVRLDEYHGLWQPFAQYLASHENIPGHTSVQVDLTRRWAAIRAPGVSPALGPWMRYVYFVMAVGAPR